MKRKLAVTLMATVMAVGLMSTVTAQSQESDITVNVSDTVALDARPSALAYGNDGGTGIEPGVNVSTSDDGYQHIDIENIGSVPIEQVHAEATMQQDQPFGDSSANDFDTGNFVTVSTETANNDYSISGVTSNLDNMHYINRVEFAENNPPEYLFTEDSSNSVTLIGGTTAINDIGSQRVGRFRVGEAEYFWVLYHEQSTPTTGTTDDWVLRVGDTPHTPNQLGTVDFRNEGNIDGAADYTEYNASAQQSSGQSGVSRIDSHTLVTFDTTDGSFSGDSLIDDGSEATTNTSGVTNTEARTYNLFVDGDGANGTQIIRGSVNVEQQSPQLSSGSPTYRTDETNSGGQFPIFLDQSEGTRLQPGQNFPIDIGVQLPNGVDRDRIKTGTVTIIATENSTL